MTKQYQFRRHCLDFNLWYFLVEISSPVSSPPIFLGYLYQKPNLNSPVLHAPLRKKVIAKFKALILCTRGKVLICIQTNAASFDVINAILFLSKIFLVVLFFCCLCGKCALKQFFRLIKANQPANFSIAW